MFISILALLAALSLSSVSAYYSIIGLMAIFAAAPVPIMIMGGTLEFAKIVTTLWLHDNWDRAGWKIKLYLVPAVFILMFITSLGSFGFLAKAHLDQGVPSGDIQARVALFDEKIKTERDNIDTDRKALSQLDAAVDQLMSRTTDATGAEKAANLRKAQRKERTSLSHDIDIAQKNIEKLQTDRAPIASQSRKAQADVGPIQYVAAVIYGNNPDQTTLEQAVRLVIIIIVLVFDPLAIALLLVSTSSIAWSKSDKQKKKAEDTTEIKSEPIPKIEDVEPKVSDEEIQKRIDDAVAQAKSDSENSHKVELDKALTAEQTRFNELCESCSEQAAAEEEIATITHTLKKVIEEFNALVPTVISLEEDCAALTSQDANLKVQLKGLIESYDELFEEKIALEETIKQLDVESTAAKDHVQRLAELEQEMLIKNTDIENAKSELDMLQRALVERNSEIDAIEEEYMNQNSSMQKEISNRDVTIQDLYTALQQEVAKKNEPRVELDAIPGMNTVEVPSLVATADELPLGGNASFGVNFPSTPIDGDLFLRVDYLPSKLFKWVGSRWVEIDKSITDVYAFDQEYVKLLVDKVSSGEYDIDDLNQTEQEQIAQYLNNHPK